VKYRGAAYERAIEELKALRALMKLRGQKSEAKDLYIGKMREIAREFSISEKTVYRDMRKKIPGLRKTRNDQGKVRSKLNPGTKEKAEELMKAGKTKKDVKKRLRISEKKLARISRGTEAGAETGTSKFGVSAKKFFETLLEYDLIGPDKGISVKSPNGRFIVHKDDLKDVILILTNAYNRQCVAEEKKLKFDRTELRSAMMEHLIEEQMRLAKESADYKLVEALTRMIDRLKEDAALPDDFGTIMKVCQELRPQISQMEVIAAIKKAANEG
jgi:hypothetical protein